MKHTFFGMVVMKMYQIRSLMFLEKYFIFHVMNPSFFVEFIRQSWSEIVSAAFNTSRCVSLDCPVRSISIPSLLLPCVREPVSQSVSEDESKNERKREDE